MADSLDIANQLLLPVNVTNNLLDKQPIAVEATKEAAQIAGIKEPAFFEAMDYAFPTITQSMGYSSFRGSNTLLRGGFMDFKRFHLPGASGRYHFLNRSGQLTNPGSGRFFGGQIFGGRGMGRVGRRAQKAALANKQGLLKAARLNNIGLKSLSGRFHSLSVFSGSAHMYSPFGAAGMIGRTGVGRSMAKVLGLNLSPDELAFGPGLFSNLSAGMRADAIGIKSASRGGGLLGGRTKAMNKMNRSINALADMRGISPTLIQDALATGGAGVRGNLYASTAAGVGTSAILGYSRGVLGAGGQGGLMGTALTYAEKAEQKFATKFVSMGLGTEAEGIAKLRSTFGKSFIREMGGLGQASKFGSFLGQRALFAALPVFNAVTTMSILYSVGKLMGMGIKGAINLTKDAGKSLQGTIAKPLFGMGYKDTEAAATSRARGVMAIQNSQLNARSALGSEAGMLAAHFG